MKKYIVIILFFLHNPAAYTQVFKGIVCDARTLTEIPFASIYFDGTSAGTTSDEHGRFVLDCSEYPTMPVTISAIGYYSVTIKDVMKKKFPTIYLKARVYELSESLVKAKSLLNRRKMYLKTFKAEFLGTTQNAKSCTILNEKDITFDYNSSVDTLKAFAFKPIIVENKALGYTITYFLEKFEYYWLKEAVFFYGHIQFKENKTTGEIQNVQLESRKQTYQGSMMHFFRSLMNNDLKAQGFMLLTPVNEQLHAKDVVVRDTTNQIFLHYNSPFNVWYKGRYTNFCLIKKFLYFDRNGYFDPSGLQFSGDMAKKRIADWLPYEYTMEK